MSHAVAGSGTGGNALQLRPIPADPARVAGRVEHVLSGRCHEFGDGAELLAWLARAQTQGVAAAAGPVSGAA